MEKSFISIENLSFSYGSKKVLDNINLNISEGEFVAVIGYNGSGKSTLARLLNGILTPTSGKIFICGLDTADEENLPTIRRKVGMVFQNPDNQIVATVVEEDVAFAPENLGICSEEIEELVSSSLDTVGMTKHRLDSPHKLSGGQKQRIAIAGVLAMQPKCIILDEPTAMLDPKGRQMVIDVIQKLHKNGITVILITHFMEEAALADRIVVMAGGNVIFAETPSETFRHYDELYELGLDVPQATEVAHLLNKADKSFKENVTTNEQCVDAICSWIGGAKQ